MNHDMNSHIYNKPNVAAFAALRVKDRTILPPSEKKDVVLLVACTHVLFNDNRGDIKLAQMNLITQTLQLLKEYYGMNSVFMFYLRA